MNSHDTENDYTWSWKEIILGEIDLLTWSNQFQNDRDMFLEEIAGAASMNDKLNSIAWKSHVHWLCTLPCSNSKKLCYGAMVVANKYDNDHQLTSDCCPPSMLYSLIREIPECFTQFNNCT